MNAKATHALMKTESSRNITYFRGTRAGTIMTSSTDEQLAHTRLTIQRLYRVKIQHQRNMKECQEAVFLSNVVAPTARHNTS